MTLKGLDFPIGRRNKYIRLRSEVVALSIAISLNARELFPKEEGVRRVVAHNTEDGANHLGQFSLFASST